jgi:hypothetical protein
VTDSWETVYSDVEDLLGPQLELDAWERTLYYHLLRHTRLKGIASAIFAVGPLSQQLPLSDFKVRDALRSLHSKGCINIEDRSRLGHLISVLLPSEIPSLSRPTSDTPVLDIESIDFYSGRLHVRPILERENHACFYCLKALTPETCELDHLAPRQDVLDNSYRNVVAACHGCNKAKGASPAQDFLRTRYRLNLLNDQELQSRFEALEAVQSGTKRPRLA